MKHLDMRTIWTAVFLLLVCKLPLVAQQAPKGYGIIVDNTLSMMNVVDSEILLAEEFVRALDKNSYVSYFAFATDPVSKRAELVRGLQCTQNRELLIEQIKLLFSVSGQTSLFDGIKAAARQMTDQKPGNCPEFSETHLLLITDGEDRASVTKAPELVGFLKSTGIKVSVIGLITGLSDDRGFLPKSSRALAREFIDRLAKETGGNVVYPKKDQSVSQIVRALLDSKTKR